MDRKNGSNCRRLAHGNILSLLFPFGNAITPIAEKLSIVQQYGIAKLHTLRMLLTHFMTENTRVPTIPIETTESKHRETKYSKWLNAAIEKYNATGAELTLAELGRRVNSDYNYIWRLSVGVRKKPGANVAIAIGRLLGDVLGSLGAADIDLPDEIVEMITADPLSGVQRHIVGESHGKPVEVLVSPDTPEDELRQIKLAVQIALAQSGAGRN